MLAIGTISLVWSASRQIGLMEEDQRPWVGFEIVRATNAKPGEPLEAVRARFRTDWWDTKERRSECVHDCSESFLLPGASVQYAAGIPGNMTDFPKTAPAIFGRVDYRDQHGNRYWTTLCRYYEKAFSGLSACSEGDCEIMMPNIAPSRRA